jgi:hypothetical protein
MKMRIRGPMILGLAMIAASCMPEGGGSDTETLTPALTGTVSLRSGAPAAGALVKLVPSGFDPARPDDAPIRRTLADASGKYLFADLDTGKTYNVIAGKPGDKAWAFVGEVRAGGAETDLFLDPAKVFLISLHAEAYTRADSGVAFFPGTDILARCDGITVSAIDSVPAGVLRLVVESRAGWKHDTTLVSVNDTAKVRADRDGIIYTP